VAELKEVLENRTDLVAFLVMSLLSQIVYSWSLMDVA